MFNQKIDMRAFNLENHKNTLKALIEFLLNSNRQLEKKYVVIKDSSTTPFDRFKHNIHSKN